MNSSAFELHDIEDPEDNDETRLIDGEPDRRSPRKANKSSKYRRHKSNNVRRVTIPVFALSCFIIFVASLTLGYLIGHYGSCKLNFDPRNQVGENHLTFKHESNSSKAKTITTRPGGIVTPSSCQCNTESAKVLPSITFPGDILPSSSHEINPDAPVHDTIAQPSTAAFRKCAQCECSSSTTLIEETIIKTEIVTNTIDIQPTKCVSAFREMMTLSVTPSSENNANTNSGGLKPTYNKCKRRDPFTEGIKDTSSSLSPFAALTAKETKKVVNAIKNRGYSTWTQYFEENRISHVYLLRPNKTDVLGYLDKQGQVPDRYAVVHVIRPNASPPDVMRFKVGPTRLFEQEMAVEQLMPNGTITINRKPVDSVEMRHMYAYLGPHLKVIDRLLRESFDNASHSDHNIGPAFSLVPINDLTDRISHVEMGLPVSGTSTMSQVPVSCTLHHPGENTADWYVDNWYYLSQGPFNSSKSLMHAYDNSDIQKIAYPKNYRQLHKSEFNLEQNDSLPERTLNELPPPRSFEPEGARYSISENTISWMGWQFEFSSDSVRGPGIYDIRFSGDRIAYEISLQDITLIYHSQTNGHGPVALSDTHFILGFYDIPRMGLDCPDRSSVLNATFFYEGYPVTRKAVCVFEAVSEKTLWRHRGMGLVDNYLVVRTAITVGNYDYTVEWYFHLDGKVETKLTASGYLYGGFWGAEDPFLAKNGDQSSTPFGYRLSDTLEGPIHDHTFAFKVDLDILGVKNSFQKVKWKAGTIREAYDTEVNTDAVPKFFYYNTTRYIEREFVEYESNFTLNPLQPEYWVVLNEHEKNAWGAQRGYRIITSSQFAEILHNDHPLVNAWDHMKYHLAVSKHKDTEQFTTDSLYMLSHTDKKLVLERMQLNEEPVRNEDLVMWVSEKFLHLPTAEDVPMTMTVPKGFVLKPFNYFDRSPTFDLRAFYDKKSQPYTFEQCLVDS